MDFCNIGACLEYSEFASLGAEFLPHHVLVGHAGSLVQIRAAGDPGNDAFCPALGGMGYFVGIVLVVVTYFSGCALCERIAAECKSDGRSYGKQSERVVGAAIVYSPQHCVGDAPLECHVWHGVIWALVSEPLALGWKVAGFSFFGVYLPAPSSQGRLLEYEGTERRGSACWGADSYTGKR